MNTRTIPSVLAAATLLTLSAHADLILHYEFEGGVDDSSPQANNGNILADPSFSDDTPSGNGQSLQLANTGVQNQGVEVTDGSTLGANPFTLAYWIKPANTQEGAGLERLTSRQGDQFETAIGNASALGGTISPTGLTLSYFQGGWNMTNVPIEVDQWVHVAWVNSATGMELFLDGVSAYTGPAVAGGRPGTGFMKIGTRHNDIEGFDGLMDDFRLYDEALDAVAVSLLASPADPEDQDGDGLPDIWETANELDPADGTGDNGAEGDPDGDGLSNLEEFDNSTSPNNADTDGDQIEDGDEIANGTNPSQADSDGDGLDDGQEATAGTDPLEADSDSDGFTDGDEIARGSDPLDAGSFPAATDLLVLHLDFEQNVDDQSGSGNDGSLLSGADYASDVPASLGGGGSLSLVGLGEDAGVEIPASDTLSSNEFTLAYWIKPTANQGNAGLERITSRSGDQFETAVGNAGAVGGTTSPSGLTLSFYAPAVGWNVTNVEITPDEWVHVAWVNNQNALVLYLDGVEAHTGARIPDPHPGAGMMRIGTRHNSVEGFEGHIDDFRLYGGVLDESQIQDLLTGNSSRIPLRITHDDEADELTISWDSVSGKLYNLRSATNPAETEPVDWPVFDGLMDLAATPPENSLTFALPPEGARFFVIEEFNAPPVSIYFEDFESGQGDWTVGTEGAAGTAWALGAPSNVGPTAAGSGTNCFGTNLDANYAADANIWVRSPVIDLTTAGGATLHWSQFIDIEQGFDAGSVRVLNDDDTFLANVEDLVDGVTTDWESASSTMPGEALGKMIKIEFRFSSDNLEHFAGWYIDDVQVTVP